MQQTLTKSLILFISGVYLLSMVQPNLQNDLALWGYGIEQGQIYRLFTVALVHGGLVHLICNMLAFFSIGTLLENYYGRNRYIALLFISLTFGSLASYIFNPPQASAVGASGMIFGLFGAYAILRKKMGGNLREALTLVAVNMAIPLLIPGIDWKAHLGGLIGGALTALVLKPARGNISQL